jgi:hypothetical protein
MKIYKKIKFILYFALFYTLIFSFCETQQSSNSGKGNSNQNKSEQDNKQRKSEKSNTKILKKYQVGLLAKTPDGPLSEEDEKKAIREQEQLESGEIKKNALVGVVYISENLRKKNLGKFRIKSDGVHMLFPTDKNITDNGIFKVKNHQYKIYNPIYKFNNLKKNLKFS